MNKTITLAASVAAVLGLGAMWAFGKIDGQTFGLISATVATTMYGILQKIEAGAARVKQAAAESKLLALDSKFEDLKAENGKLKSLNGSLVTSIKEAGKTIESLQTKASTEGEAIVIEPVLEVKKGKRK